MPAQVQRIQRQALRLLHSLPHENLCRLFALVEVRNETTNKSIQRHFQSTESISLLYPLAGINLKQHLLEVRRQNSQQTPARSSTFTVVQLIRMAQQVACGIAHLHEQQILHGDVAVRNC